MPFHSVAPGVTRIAPEEQGGHGYIVRMQRSGKRFVRFFADGISGGERKAKAAALAYHAKLLKKHGEPNHRTTVDLLTHRNSSGHVGIHIARSIDTRWSGNEYFAYCASWNGENKSRKKISFSWIIHGKATALALAKLAREKKLTDRDTVIATYEKQTGKSAYLPGTAATKESKAKAPGKASPKKSPRKKSTSATVKVSAAKKKSAKAKATSVAATKKRSGKRKGATTTLKKGIKRPAKKSANKKRKAR